MKVKEFYTNHLRRVFTMIDGELTFVKVNSTIFNLESGVVEYKISLPDGTERVLEGDIDFYENEDEFKKGESKHSTVITTTELLDSNFIAYDHDENGVYPFGWVMKDGEPAKVALDFKTYNFHKDCFNDLDFEWWKTRDVCLENNDYTIVNEDGTKTFHRSLRGYIKLNDEQKKAIAVVEDAIKQAESKGIRFVYNGESDRISFVNDPGNLLTYDCDFNDDKQSIGEDEIGAINGFILNTELYVNFDHQLMFK